MANRISKNATIALSSPSALSSKPACPAGLRDGGLSLLISAALSTLTPEDQAEHEPNPKSREHCLSWILADILLGVFLKCSNAASAIAPGLFCFPARVTPGLLRFSPVFLGESPGG